MHGAILTDDAGGRFDGEMAVSDYTWESAAARAYGQANVGIERDHEILENPAITDLQGAVVGISHDLLGNWTGVNLGRGGHDEWRWHLDCYQRGALLKTLTVPSGLTLTGLPAGVIAKEALRLALEDSPIGSILQVGSFAEAPPVVQSITFSDQSVDSIFTQLMDLTGQEYQISETGRVDWTAPVGDVYPTVLTEGYDFVLLGYDPQEPPVRRVIVTDQRGETAQIDAPEHMTNIAARVVRTRADTASLEETYTVAEGILGIGRVVPQVFEIGLLPKGGTIVVTIPGPTTGGGSGLYGAGLYGAGLYGGGGGSPTTIDMDWPIIDAPNWAIREGDFVRIITPGANLRGTSPLCRVLSRTFGDAHLIPTLKLVSVPQWTPAMLPAAKQDRGAEYQPPQTLERRIVDFGLSQGLPVDVARLRSQLAPVQVPALSSLTGAVTATQVPALSALTGAVTAAQIPSGGVVADAAAAPTQAEFNALTAALRAMGAID